MGENKNGFRKTKYLFDPQSKNPFRLSRSRLEGFINCPRCFYLDRRLGVEPPGMPAFTLNSAVDALLKKEFDTYRRQRKAHPLMLQYKIEAVPFAHPLLDEWREPFKGVRFHHPATNLIIFGAVDDLWVNEEGEIIVVDYKATSTEGPITLESEYRQAYKRQMEIYQWLLRQQRFKVTDIGYFVYCNGNKSKGAFEAKLEFSVEIIAYEGHDDWVERAVVAAHKCLMADALPDYTQSCRYCNYRKAARSLETQGRLGPEVQGELFSFE